MTSSRPTQQLERFATEIGKPYGYERSVKLGEAGLFDERFLMTFRREACGERLLPALNRLGQDLGIPESFAKALSHELSDPGSTADIVHLGFEDQPDGGVCKVYLEHAEAVRNWLQTAGPGAPAKLVHIGYKWQPQDNRHRAVTRYFCQAGLAWPQIRACVTACYDSSSDDERHAAPRAIAGKLLDALESGVVATDIMLMQVEEEGNPRNSFDLNLYGTGWKVGSIAPLLQDMAACFAVDGQGLEQLQQVAANQRLGHLAGGIDRHGKSFFSVYFGKEARSA